MNEGWLENTGGGLVTYTKDFRYSTRWKSSIFILNSMDFNVALTPYGRIFILFKTKHNDSRLSNSFSAVSSKETFRLELMVLQFS